ncbi:MAG: YdeI/OmpD-associated family protein [Tabrizicola sp.]|nr:YdeI/OmpD-associated family protein [Tabrizicola sp.]
MATADDAPIVTVRSRAELRAWLAENHATAKAVWLAAYRKHHPDYMSPEEGTEELLCWGWINSVPRALDEDRSMILIAPRKPGSAWSAVNKALVEKARASGAMTLAGEAKIAAAIANGQWDFLNDVEALADPPDLTSALTAAGAVDFWTAQPRSIRRAALEWIKTAKTQDTRNKRIRDVTESAAMGLRPTPFRR